MNNNNNNFIIGIYKKENDNSSLPLSPLYYIANDSDELLSLIIFTKDINEAKHYNTPPSLFSFNNYIGINHKLVIIKE